VKDIRSLFYAFINGARSFISRIEWWIFSRRDVYYIGGNEALPPPLSSEEEKKLVDQLREGNEEIRAVLIERNLRLVVYIARKFENTGISIEDLISIGTIGLIKAVNTFDPAKNQACNIRFQMYRK
jgi:RNA polymerase sporulation-specific sigma factor